MPINTHEDEYEYWKPIWDKIDDAVSGQDAIKKKGDKYLPILGGQDTDSYEAYKKRAQYNNLVGRTLNIAMGQLFRKNPTIKGVTDEYITNINLAGSHFNHLSREIFWEVICKYRIGVLVDYSDIKKRPYLTTYKADAIINWREDIIDGEEKLSLVVLEGEECYYDQDDPYKEKSRKKWKELYLEDGAYKTREWVERYNNETRKTEIVPVPGSEVTPLMAGQPLEYIPFYFITPIGISDDLWAPPMLDMVNANLGHYINSADYENMLHWTGAKTVITKGWDISKAFPIGGSAEVGTDGDAQFLEASSDSGLKEEMRHKEELMAMMGSQMLSGKGRYVASAQTAQISSEGEYATLADIANSVSYSMQIVMTTFMLWAGSNEPVTIEYNTDYTTQDIPHGKLTELIGAVQSGLMSYETYYYIMNSYEMYPNGWTIEAEQKAIANKQNSDAANRLKSIDQQLINNMSQ